MLERHFHLAENDTTVRREMLGGLTTFLTMAYIVVVNPQILAQAGIPAEGVVFATCIASAAATLVMGLYANYPIALAPGMSLNAYFTYSVCLGMHVPWRTALGVIFFSGVCFLILTVTRIREQIVNGIPDCLKHSTAAGIGMFIAFVGLRNARLVVANPATFVSLGNFSDREVQAACIGLVLAVILMVRKVSGAILISIFATTLLGILRGMAKWPAQILSLPHPSYTWLQLDLRAAMQLGLAGDCLCIPLRRSLRQRGHAGGSLRAGRIRQGRQDSPRRPRAHVGRDRNDFRSADRNLHGDQLHRKRRRCRRGRAHGTQ